MKYVNIINGDDERRATVGHVYIAANRMDEDLKGRTPDR